MTTKALMIDIPAPEDLARLAHLKYILDDEPGFGRHMNGSGFQYLNAHGSKLRDTRHIRRIDSLAIPPAWKEVWICRQPDGHLQATGRDDRGRKQYIYHEQWREISNKAKFLRLKSCIRFLPVLRRQVSRDLRGNDLSRTRVLAGLVALLDLTSIRIGNEEYVRENHSYGLATLRTRHVTFEGNKAILRFRGKSGLRREAIVEDKQLTRLLKQLRGLRGAHIFQFVDDAGRIHAVDSIAVNQYLDELSGHHHFTAKDFRTWKASAVAAGLLYREIGVEKLAARKKVVKQVFAAVAETLGNTPTVCRKYYVHPGLIEKYLDGKLAETFQRFRPSRSKTFSIDEQLLARFLRCKQQ
jgi:DNA topoisomerase-1